MQKRSYIIVAALLIMSAAAVDLIAGGAVANAWTMATTKQSDTFTSLSFVNTGKLPTYAPAGKMHELAFQIGNHESAATTYNYTVLLDTGTAATVLDKGTVTIPTGQMAERAIDFTLPNPEMTARITVQLNDRAEHITFEAKS